jgi:glycosyltransferase involved in cell wall biosynthesis
MCTYNGELYIREQLDSIAAQTRLPDRLVVFDDRSSDRTVDILRDFADQAPFPVQIEINSENLGPALNFSQISRISDADYVFSCDQDDIWRQNKISTEMDAMAALEDRYGKDVPLLVHSDLETVDQDLRQIAPSFMTSQGYRHPKEPLKVLVAQNFVTGCTVLVNRPALNIAMPIPDEAIMHDWWMALVVAACGHIGFVPAPLVRYRQHAANQIGAKPADFETWWNRPSRRTRKLKARLHTLDTIRQAKALEQRLAEINGANKISMDIVHAYATVLAQPFWLRPIQLLQHGIHRQTAGGKFKFAILMALLHETVPDRTSSRGPATSDSAPKTGVE